MIPTLPGWKWVNHQIYWKHYNKCKHGDGLFSFIFSSVLKMRVFILTYEIVQEQEEDKGKLLSIEVDNWSQDTDLVVF